MEARSPLKQVKGAPEACLQALGNAAWESGCRGPFPKVTTYRARTPSNNSTSRQQRESHQRGPPPNIIAFHSVLRSFTLGSTPPIYPATGGVSISKSNDGSSAITTDTLSYWQGARTEHIERRLLLVQFQAQCACLRAVPYVAIPFLPLSNRKCG